MATDWTSPKTSDTHTNELAATRGRDESNARMDYTGDTNIPDGTIRWNKANNRFEIWSAASSTWSVLSSKYLINVDTVDGYHAGNASGNVPVSNGTVNTNLNSDKLDGQHGTFFQARANHTGTQAPSTISPQGAGSGLDADKLDGKHASEFVYTTGGTMTGDLTVPTVNGDIFVADTRAQTINPEDINNRVTVDFKSGSTIGLPGLYYLVWTMRPWGDDSGGPAHQIANGSDGMFYRSGTEASGWGAWYKIWHAGNDGSGSGLDADLLDGLDSSRYHKAAVSIFTGGDWNSLTQHGTYKIDHETFDNDTNHPPATYAWGILNVFVSEVGGENRISQIYIPHQSSFDKYIYERMFNGSDWTEWRKIWRGGTGSGSGLDADMLDGKHLSEIWGGIWDVIIEDRKPQGTGGGTFTSGAWRTRDLNTLVFNPNSLASLSNNRFTLPAGTYCIDWDAPAQRVNRHKTRLYNYTNSTVVAYGTSEYATVPVDGLGTTSRSCGTTVITITRSTAFIIQHYCGVSSSVGFGEASSFGTEVYTRVRIKKIA